MQQNFSESETKKVFEDSENQYDKKIQNTFSKINQKNLNNNDLYTNFFKRFAQISKENSKIFSKLKHE